MSYFHNLNANDFIYALGDDDKLYVQLRRRKPTRTDPERLVNLGRPFVVNGAKYRSLARDYPAIFDAPVEQKQKPKPAKLWYQTMKLATVHQQGFPTKKAATAYIKANNVASLEDFIANHSQGEPFLRAKDVTSKFTTADWIKLGFNNGADGRRFRQWVRTNKPHLLDNATHFALAAKRYVTGFTITGFKELNSRYSGARINYEMTHEGVAADIERYLNEAREHLINLIREYQGTSVESCKVQIVTEYSAFLYQPSKTRDGNQESITAAYDAPEMTFEKLQQVVDATPENHQYLNKSRDFRSKCMAVVGDASPTVIDEILSEQRPYFDRLDELTGSGWVTLWANKMYVNIWRYEPLRGAAHMPLPDYISPQCCVNPQNRCDDEKDEYRSWHGVTKSMFMDLCFFYAIIIAKHMPLGDLPTTNPGRISEKVAELSRRYMKHPNFSKADFPMTLDRSMFNRYEDVFEVNIWVWRADNKARKPLPCERSPRKFDTDILLLFIEGEKHEPTSENPDPFEEGGHYLWLRYPRKIVRRHVTEKGKDDTASYFPCLNCTAPHRSKESLMTHERTCMKREACVVKLPKEGAPSAEVCFKKKGATLPVPRAIFSDFEAFNSKPVDDKGGKVISSQFANSSHLVVKDFYEDKVVADELFFGADCGSQLMNAILKHAKDTFDTYYAKDKRHPLVISDDERQKMKDEAKGCCICGVDFDFSKRFTAHIHHNHLKPAPDNIIGNAHPDCNKATHVNPIIPVFFHNFRGYDSHLLLPFIHRDMYHRMEVIPDSNTKFKHITLHMRDEVLAAELEPQLFKRAMMYKIHDRCDKLVVHKTTGKVVRDRELFEELVRNLDIDRRIKDTMYRIEFKDSRLFLQDSLENVAKSLSDSDFKATREYITTLRNPSKAELASLCRERRDLVCEIMGFGDEDAEKKLKKFSKQKSKERLKQSMEVIKDLKFQAFLADPDVNDFVFRCCRRKGVYCYDAVDSWEFFDTPHLPPKEAFVSRLQHNCADIDSLSKKHSKELDHDYSFAELVWEMFGFSTFRNYHDHYLRLDTYILTDAMDAFRRFFQDTFGLDPLHFPTLPSAAKQAAFKFSKAHFNVFTEGQEGMLDMTEASVHGGISTVGRLRYAKANNKYLPKAEDKSKPTSYVQYVDANALYAHVMTMMLPYGDFEWVEKPAELDLMALNSQAERGYLLEVDAKCPPCYRQWDTTDAVKMERRIPLVEYLEKRCTGCDGCTCLHDYQADYPCLPENMAIPTKRLSANQRKWAAKDNGTVKEMGDKKLMTTLDPKSHYCVHLKTLQVAVDQGWEVTTIHRAFSYAQKSWLSEYILSNICRRKASIERGDSYGKAFFKLMNNIIFGSMLTDPRKYGSTKIYSKSRDEKLYKRCVARMTFGGEDDINDDLTAVNICSQEKTMNAPLIVGSAILDLAKAHMQEFWYMLKRHYGDNLQMVYTDTDSFILYVECEDFYKDAATLWPDQFDFSNLDEEHPYYTKVGASELGRFKFETSDAILEVAAVRSKMYSYMTGDSKVTTWDEKEGNEDHHCTLKGVPKVVQRSIMHQQYVDCVLQGTKLRREYYQLVAKKHDLQVVSVNKLALSPFNDKSYLCDDGTQLPWGHAAIPK